MSIEPTTVFIITMVVVNVAILGVVLLFPQDGLLRRSRASARDADGRQSVLPALPGGSLAHEPALALAAAPSAATQDRIVRILWWLTIITALAGVGVSGAFPRTQALIFAGGGLAAAVVFVLHDLLPERWVTPLKFALEGLFATAVVTALLTATGFGSSPFFFGYYLIAVGGALALGRRATLVYAALAGLAYTGVLYLDPRAPFSEIGLLRAGLNIGSVWLVSYLAAFFATEERRARAAIVRLSVTDALTGLFNRSQVHIAVEQEIRRTRRSERGFCLLMIDLDGLKAINDVRGHHQGDEVLKALGAVITRSIRNVDMAARYGGDEFVVLLPETDAVGALVVAEKIRAGAEDLAFGVDRHGLATSVSIGLVAHPEDGTTVDDLLIAADRAMYASKALGKNQISTPPDRTPRTTLPALARPVDRGGGRAVAVPVAERGEPDADAGESTTTRPQDGTNGAAPDGPDPALPEEPSVGPDPAEARSRISRLSYDPDHQVRRAMDAFLSRPGRSSSEEQRDMTD